MVDPQTAVTGPGGQPYASARLFTTWFTSGGDRLDHAVTDEAFVANRYDPKAVCSAIVSLMPMAYPNQRHCPRCTALLDAHRVAPDERGCANQRSHAQVMAAGAIHPIRWFRQLIDRERSHAAQPWLLPEAPVPALRDRSQTPAAVRSSLAAVGPIPTPGTDVLQVSVSGVASPSIAVSTPATDDAVPTRSAGSARHARGRDGSQPLVDVSPLAPRWPEHDQACPVEAATPSYSRRRLHLDHEMSADSRAKGRSCTAATTGAAPPDAPVVDDGAATPTASPATSR
jgi:hypothetical protein